MATEEHKTTIRSIQQLANTNARWAQRDVTQDSAAIAYALVAQSQVQEITNLELGRIADALEYLVHNPVPFRDDRIHHE